MSTVIKYPVPQFFQHHDNGAPQYNEIRVQKLVQFVETRFGKGRCFFSFLQDQGQRKPHQIEVTQLYALHEVQHWHGALSQVEWTSFVMANIEYDDMIRQDVSCSLTVPVLPEAALPVYRLMKESQDAELSRACARTGKTVGQLVEGNINLYANENAMHVLNAVLLTPEPALTPILDHSPGPAPLLNLLESNSPLPVAKTPANVAAHDSDGLDRERQISRTTFRPNGQTRRPMRVPRFSLRQVAQNERLFKDVEEQHRHFVDKMVRKIQQYTMRIICRLSGREKETWDTCFQHTKDYLKKLFAHTLHTWQERSRIPFDEARAPPGPLDKQISFLCAYYAVTDPLPKSGLNRKIVARMHFIKALERQRRVLEYWRQALKKKAEERTGVRYRQEGGFVLDLWTGGCEKAEEFDERTRHEELRDPLVVL